MRAALLTEQHRFEVAEVADPAPGPEQLVLAVRACGICGSDLKVHTQLPAGTVLGHEFCGEVVAVGREAAHRWHEGQFAAAMPLSACGRCRWCLAGEPAHCGQVALVGVGGAPGAFAQYVAVTADLAVPLPLELGPLGALVEPLAVGLHAVGMAGMRPGQKVLVLGGGNVGAAVALWARRLGAAQVVVSEPAAARREAAALFGATDVHDPTQGPAPGGFDVVLECVGAPGLLQTAVDAAGTRGRVVMAGVCMAPDPLIPITALLKEVEVRFAVYYTADEFAAAAALVQTGEVDAGALVTDTVGFEGVTEAFGRLLSSTQERKILVAPGG